MRRTLAVLILASFVTGAPMWAVCANAQAASLFQEVELRPPPKRSHTVAWITGITGVGLLAASFPLAKRADERYELYLFETDVSRIDERFRDSKRADRLANSALITGEVLLVSAVYLRFIRRPSGSRTALLLQPDRCAVSYRF